MTAKKTTKKQPIPSRGRESALACGVQAAGCHVREITLATGALLEQVGSPLMDGRTPENFMDMLPTFFVMTRPPAESMALLAQGDEAFDAAMIGWADTLPPSAFVDLSKAVRDVNARLARAAGTGAGAEGNAPSAERAG